MIRGCGFMLTCNLKKHATKPAGGVLGNLPDRSRIRPQKIQGMTATKTRFSRIINDRLNLTGESIFTAFKQADIN